MPDVKKPVQFSSPGARHIEIIEFDRRQFLRIAGGALVALGGFGLVGCGGSGGGGIATSQFVALKGSIEVPSGFSVAASSMRVMAGLASTPVTASLGFGANVSSAGPSL